MCEDTWRRLDADFDRIIAGLEVVAVDPGGNRPTAALAGEGRADIGREGRANVYEFKRPGAVAPGKVSAQGYPEQGGKTLKTAKPGSARYAPARRANR